MELHILAQLELPAGGVNVGERLRQIGLGIQIVVQTQQAGVVEQVDRVTRRSVVSIGADRRSLTHGCNHNGVLIMGDAAATARLAGVLGAARSQTDHHTAQQQAA